jgi:hypothetical protein
MTMPASGPISFSQLQTEFGGTNPIGFDEYYSGGANLPSGGVALGIPASGAVSMSQYYGKNDIRPGNSGVITSGSSFVLPATSGATINVIAIGGGGGGGGGSNRRTNGGYKNGGGGGGSGAAALGSNIPVSPGQTVTFSIGGGGGAGGKRDGIFNASPGSNGGPGGATVFYVNGARKLQADGGGGGYQAPNLSAGAKGSVAVGTVALAANDGLAAIKGTSIGGFGAKGFGFNAGLNLPLSSIIGYGINGTAGGPGSGVPCVAGTGQGAGGTGGGTAQGDAQNSTNANASGGVAGAIFIWWGY